MHCRREVRLTPTPLTFPLFFRLPLTALHGAWLVAGTKEQSSRRKVPILADQRLF